MSEPLAGLIQRRVFVSGKVQGVFFRASAAREADRHAGLRGFVRNLPDGRVEAVFSGAAAAVNAMVEWSRHGPPTARVSGVEVVEEPVDPELRPFGVG